MPVCTTSNPHLYGLLICRFEQCRAREDECRKERHVRFIVVFTGEEDQQDKISV